MDPIASDISKSPGRIEVVKGNLFSFLQILLIVNLYFEYAEKYEKIFTSY